jgi:enoyl-CoA hydratase
VGALIARVVGEELIEQALAERGGDVSGSGNVRRRQLLQRHRFQRPHRLPRLIGQSRAMDLILTGRGVDGEEAGSMGLANRVVPPGTALDAALELAEQLASFPRRCLIADRASALSQWSLPEDEALRRETRGGLEVIRSGETRAGASRFAGGAGRHGSFDS